MSNPTFVFSLGAWMGPAFLDDTRSRLDALGFPSECPAHPSIGAEPPTKTLANDVASLRSLLAARADEDRDLIVVGHSYGGVVISSAVEGLTKSARAGEGKTGGVVKVVYLSAFALDKGQILMEILGGNPLPWMKVEGDYVHAEGTGDIFWHDISPEEQEKWNKLLLHTSGEVFSGEATYEPWRDVPCAYIICEEDHALLPPFQEVFASKMGAENTYRLPSLHSPFLSTPDRLVDVLLQIAKA